MFTQKSSKVLQIFYPEVDQLSLFFSMTIALEKSESVWLMMLIFEHLSSGVSLPNIYQLRVWVVNDMVDVTNVLPAALKYSLLVIHAFYMAQTPLLDYIFTSMLQLRAIRYRQRPLQTFFITRIRQWMTFSLPEIIS